MEYDSKYVTELQKMLEVFQALRHYFTDDVNAKIDQMAKSTAAFSPVKINYLKVLKEQVTILHQLLHRIISFSYVTLKNVDAVVNALQSEKNDLQYLSHINTAYTQSKIAPLNAALDLMIAQAG